MKKVFTTGQVAKLVRVAPRTVSKWFDSGRLQGYKVPGSNDRRIPREALIRFLEENGMPLGELAGADEEKSETREQLQPAFTAPPAEEPRLPKAAPDEPWEP